MAKIISEDSRTEHEDVDRMPDGVPHGVVGLTAVFSVILAIMTAVMFIVGSGMTRVAGLLIFLIAIPALVSSLSTKSERDRDHVHPSR